MMICKHCGEQNPGSNQFCGKCGQKIDISNIPGEITAKTTDTTHYRDKIASAERPWVKCAKCSHEMPDYTLVCPECGELMETKPIKSSSRFNKTQTKQPPKGYTAVVAIVIVVAAIWAISAIFGGNDNAADITTNAYNNLETEPETTHVAFETLTFEGTGDKVLSDISLPVGYFKAEITHFGSSNFIVENKTSGYENLLVNAIGFYSGTVLLTGNEYTLLQIQADGDWKVEISVIGEGYGIGSSGTGDDVSDIFEGKGEQSVLSINYTGDSNFIVQLYQVGSDYPDLIVNEISAYSGECVVETKSGYSYFWVVTADGFWSISN